ncbi:MAG: O-antigen ligase family protein [Candidatus Merdisoma sp.]|jgi:hypothetical protein
MNWLKEHEIDSWILRAAFVFMLLFPAFYSPHTDVYQSAYYAGFSWAYFLLVLYMLLQLVWNRGKLARIHAAAAVYFGVLLLYNVLSLYFNHKYLHWYWEQINNTVAFLFMAALLGFQIRLDEGKHDNIRFLMRCIVISNVGSIIYYLLGYTNLLICNNQFIFFELPSNFYETRHYWIYSHKSEYALMLVAFMALFTAYRKKFKNMLTFLLSMAVLLFCLYLTHSWTGIAGVFLIILGGVLDQVNWKEFRPRKWHFAAAAVFLAAGGAVAWEVLSERNIMTLGDRVPIWKAVWQVILDHPEGWGMRFGTSMIQTETGLLVNNAHNVFLNQMLRFSIPVGICFILLFLGLVVYTLVKSRSFLMAGTWLALLLLLDMDYSMMSLQMALLFLIVYLVSIKKKNERLKQAL